MDSSNKSLMKREIKVPSVGESVTQAEIESWEKQEGAIVRKGEILVILETDKASMEIPAEINGKLSIVKKKGDTVNVGDVIAYLEPSGDSPSPPLKPNQKLLLHCKKQNHLYQNKKVTNQKYLLQKT